MKNEKYMLMYISICLPCQVFISLPGYCWTQKTKVVNEASHVGTATRITYLFH